MFIGFFIMKKVLSSKGVFEISDSLYENIKKNNPELLMEDIWDHTGSNDSGMNLFIINSLVVSKICITFTM